MNNAQAGDAACPEGRWRARLLLDHRAIGETWSYRIVEQPSRVWQIEFWNGHQWTELVVLSASAYTAEDAVVAAHKVHGHEDPRTAKADPDEPPHHEMPT